jgi:site-specific DNA-methyltransferase (adenine-specific)
MARTEPIYHLDNPRTDIYVGDNRDILPQIKQGSVDLIFADPPFNLDIDYGNWRDNLPRDAYLQFTYEWLDACLRVLAPQGSIWINIPDDTAAEVVMYLKSKKLSMMNWCIWHFRFGQCRNANFIVSKVHVLYFVKNPGERIWNPEQVLEPSDRATTYADPRTRKTQTPSLRVPLDVWYGQYWGRVQGNNKERRRSHENQIPEVYMERVIRACSREGHLVLDPFLGSGTTCTIARALNRRSIGIEFSSKIAKSAFERIQEGSVRVRLTNSFETAIKRAFFSVQQGRSTEDIIINDSLRDAFLRACDSEVKKLGLRPKKEFDYNWTLENLRKAGKLGSVFSRKRREPSLTKDANYQRAKDVAFQIIRQGLSATIDHVMCDPMQRAEFDRRAHKIAPRMDLYLVRKAALNCRKKGRHKDESSAGKTVTLW